MQYLWDNRRTKCNVSVYYDADMNYVDAVDRQCRC